MILVKFGLAISVAGSASAFAASRPSSLLDGRGAGIKLGLGKTSTADDVADLYGRDLSGKVAVVTGGNSGIGLETVRVLAERGARVILCSRSAAAGKDALRGLGDAGSKKLDVSVVSTNGRFKCQFLIISRPGIAQSFIV